MQGYGARRTWNADNFRRGTGHAVRRFRYEAGGPGVARALARAEVARELAEHQYERAMLALAEAYPRPVLLRLEVVATCKCNCIKIYAMTAQKEK